MENQEKMERAIPSIFAVGLFRFIAWIVLFVALLQRQQGLIVLALFLLLLVNGAKLWSRYSLVKLNCELTAENLKLFQGEKVTVKAAVENRKLLPVWLQLKLPVTGVQSLHTGKNFLLEESSLLWYEEVSWQWELAAQKRGYHQLGPAVVLSGDLFGFFSHSKSLNKVLHLTVYPRILPVKEFTIPLREFFGTQSVKNLVEDPVAPMGIRDYQYGRSARYIHWKASARQNQLQEKVFAPTAQVKVLLAADVAQFSGIEAEEEFERMLEIVASLAVELDKRGIPVGLAVNGLVQKGTPIVPIGKGPGQMTAILETLARLQMNFQKAIIDVLRTGVKLTGDTSCIYFCHHLDAAAENTANYLRYQCKIPLVFIVNELKKTTKREDFIVHRLDQIYREEATKGA